jgi:hypothetical protein
MALDPPPAGARAGLLGGLDSSPGPKKRTSGRQGAVVRGGPLVAGGPPWAGGAPGALCCTPAHRYFRTPAVSIAERCGANAVLLTRQLARQQ